MTTPIENKEEKQFENKHSKAIWNYGIQTTLVPNIGGTASCLEYISYSSFPGVHGDGKRNPIVMRSSTLINQSSVDFQLPRVDRARRIFLTKKLSAIFDREKVVNNFPKNLVSYRIGKNLVNNFKFVFALMVRDNSKFFVNLQAEVHIFIQLKYRVFFFLLKK